MSGPLPPGIFAASALALAMAAGAAASPAWTDGFAQASLPPRFASARIYDARAAGRSVHIPTVIEGTGGVLVLAFVDYPPRGGKIPFDMDPTDTIRLMRSADGGRSWSEPKRFDSAYSLNPGFVRGPRGDLWMFFDRKSSTGQDDNNLWYSHSADNGVSWTEPVAIAVGERVHLLANNGIALPNGDLMIAYYYDRGNRDLPFDLARQDFASGVLISSDQGRTWRTHGEVTVRNLAGLPNIRSCAVEPTLVTAGNGTLRMLLRTRAGSIFDSTSADLGRTWSEARPTRLSNPNTKSAALTLKDGSAVLIWNNAQVFDGSEKRFPLMASLSEDGGGTWPFAATVNDDRVPLSYPTLIEHDGEIIVIHDRNYEELRLVRIREADLRRRWTPINLPAAWRISDGVATMTEDRPVPAQPEWSRGTFAQRTWPGGAPFPWTAWSKLVSFPPDKPGRYLLTAEFRWDGGSGAIGIFSGYQDEDNWLAWVCRPGDGRAGIERQEHFGDSKGVAHYWSAEKSWREPVVVSPGVWYRVQVVQDGAGIRWDLREAGSGRILASARIPVSDGGHFVALGTMRAKASFRNLCLSPAP